MSRFYLPLGKKNAKPSRHRQKAARFFEKFPRPGGQASAGTGHRCTEAIAGHSRRVVKCAVQGEKLLCIPPGFEPDTQLFQRPESIRQLGGSRTDIEQKRQYGEHTAEKIWQKFPAKRNTTRFDRSLKNGRSFFLSTFTSVENLAKNMFSFSIECYMLPVLPLSTVMPISTTAPKYPRRRQGSRECFFRGRMISGAAGKI